MAGDRAASPESVKDEPTPDDAGAEAPPVAQSPPAATGAGGWKAGHKPSFQEVESRFGPGRLPQLTLDDLEQDLAALEAERRQLGAAAEAGERRYVLEALIRNRQNLIELIKAGRFL